MPSPEAARAPDTLDDEAKRRLASLGYVSAGAAPVVRQGCAASGGHDRPVRRCSTRRPGCSPPASTPQPSRSWSRSGVADPYNLDAMLRLATAHSSLGHEAAALEAFRKASALAPRSPGRPDLPRAALRARQGLGAGGAAPRAGRRRVARARAGSRSARRRPRASGARAGSDRSAPADLQAAHALGRGAGAAGSTRDERAADGRRDRRVRSRARAAIRGRSRTISSWECSTSTRDASLMPPPRSIACRRARRDYPMALFKRAQVSVLLREPDREARIEAASRRADATTRPLTETARSCSRPVR